MKRLTVLALAVAVIFGTAGCGTGLVGGPDIEPEASDEVIQKEPNWYKSPPNIEGYMAAKGEGTSASKQGARRKAINSLINDFQLKTKSIAEGRSEDFFKEVGGDYSSELRQQFEQIQTVIWNGVVENWEEVNSETVVERSKDAAGKKSHIYRTYVLGRINRFEADQRLLERIKKEKELLTALEATQAYDKLQKDLDRYREKLGM